MKVNRLHCTQKAHIQLLALKKRLNKQEISHHIQRTEVNANIDACIIVLNIIYLLFSQILRLFFPSCGLTVITENKEKFIVLM